MKDYSHLGKAPLAEIDITRGWRDLVIFGHKLKSVTVVGTTTALRQRSAPEAGLNQVWTNIIHNAVDAMGGPGR